MKTAPISSAQKDLVDLGPEAEASDVVAALRDVGARYRIEGHDFTALNLSGASLAGWIVVNCNFTRADLRKANFDDARFESCEFIQSTLVRASMQRTVIVNSGFTRADLREVFGPTVQFSLCDFTGANFWAARMSRRAFVECWTSPEQLDQLDSRVQ